MWNHVYEVLKLLHTSIDLYNTDVVFVEREEGGRRGGGGGDRLTDRYTDKTGIQAESKTDR